MRISDWSSDVCSSDLARHAQVGRQTKDLAEDVRDFGIIPHVVPVEAADATQLLREPQPLLARGEHQFGVLAIGDILERPAHAQIGEEAWRERGCELVRIPEGGGSITKKKNNIL